MLHLCAAYPPAQEHASKMLPNYIVATVAANSSTGCNPLVKQPTTDGLSIGLVARKLTTTITGLSGLLIGNDSQQTAHWYVYPDLCNTGAQRPPSSLARRHCVVGIAGDGAVGVHFVVLQPHRRPVRNKACDLLRRPPVQHVRACIPHTGSSTALLHNLCRRLISALHV